MTFIIYGAGAIGSVVGGHLFKAGREVVLVGNEAHVDAISKRGLRVIMPNETSVLDIPAVKTAREISLRGDEVVLLCAKSQHTFRCLGQLKAAGASRSLPIFCCQNSISNEPNASRVLDRVYGALIYLPALFLTPGEVINPIMMSHGHIEIGCYPRGVDDLAREVMGAIQEAGFAGGINENIMMTKGAKCLGNLYNAVDAITNSTREGSEPLRAELRREAKECWQAAGIEWEPLESFEKRMNASPGEIKMSNGYERYHGSSWQSLARRTGNIEAVQLNGDVVVLGQMLGIPTPCNELVMNVALDMAAKKEMPGKYTGEDLMRMAKA